MATTSQEASGSSWAQDVEQEPARKLQVTGSHHLRPERAVQTTVKA